jgi:hypothetical protein
MKTRLDYFKKIKKGLFLKPETAWEIGFYIGWSFKKAYQKCKDRSILIKQLIRLSEVKIDNNYPYEKRREKKYGCKKRCWVCEHNKAGYFHHIVLLKNGGYNWGFNRIPICPQCHKQIHTWM